MTTTRHYLRRTAPPIGLVRPDSWRELAACRAHPEHGPQTWDDSLTSETERDRPKRIQAAQAVCAACPVRLQCLADVDPRYDEGVRGGVDLRELYRRRRGAS